MNIHADCVVCQAEVVYRPGLLYSAYKMPNFKDFYSETEDEGFWI